MTAKTLEFLFDFGSPATYLAWTQVPSLAKSVGAQVDYKPMLLGGVFKATGNASPAMVPAKGAYMLQDLQRFARRYQVPFAFNPHFPIDTLKLMRMAAGVKMHHPERLAGFCDLVFRGIWVDGLNLGKDEVLADVLEKAGYPAADIMALAAEPQVKDALKATTEEAIRRGAFGAPTFFIGNDMFFGQDRLDFVREALQSSQ